MAIQKQQLQALAKTKADDPGVRALLLDYLDSLATIDDDTLQKKLLKDLVRDYVALERRVDALLKNTLPASVAEVIKYEGRFPPSPFVCSIMFTDFSGFTRTCEDVSSDVMVGTLDTIFSTFDDLIREHRGTKIKTVGDAYMAVFGAPDAVPDHAVTAIRAAMAMQGFMDRFNRRSSHPLNMRIGIHSGKVTAGVVGKERMQFDVFGDDVNIAARFEASGAPGRINVSEATYLKARHRFAFEKRGRIPLKNKAAMRAFFVAGEATGGS
jgi:adenylate cyclase